MTTLGRLHPDSRICILGAGAAGLSAAWYFRKRGYRRVTILEKSAGAGGKCRSFVCDGAIVDLGASILMPDYRRVRAIAAEVGLRTRRCVDFKALRSSGASPQVLSVAELVREKHGVLSCFLAAWRYLAAHRRHAAVLRHPGFGGMCAPAHADLSMPFGEWAVKHGAEPLLTFFQLPLSAFGYGDVRQIATGYVLRYITTALFLTMIVAPLTKHFGGWPRQFEHGFGALWQPVAAKLDVRTNAHVQRIHRGGTVSVTWTETDRVSEETFDVLVIACAPSEITGIMDWSEAETRLFAHVQMEPYSVTVCEASGLPDQVSFVESPLGAAGLVQFWKFGPGSRPCAFYTRPQPGMSVEDIVACIREDVRALYPAAQVGRVITHVDWSYFPHVDSDTFAKGFYDAFEDVQGAGATWYSGALLAFESVENVAAYSERLVDRIIASGGHRGEMSRGSTAFPAINVTH